MAAIVELSGELQGLDFHKIFPPNFGWRGSTYQAGIELPSTMVQWVSVDLGGQALGKRWCGVRGQRRAWADS